MEDNEKIELVRNPRGLKIKIGLGAIAVVAVGLMVSFFFWLIADMSPGFEKFIVIATWLTLTGIWLASSIKFWRRWQLNQYILGPDSLIVRQAKLKGQTESYYRYDSILEVRIEMSRLGQNGDFGDIHVNIPKLNKSVVLYDVDKPDEQVERLKHVIADAGTTKAFVT